MRKLMLFGLYGWIVVVVIAYLYQFRDMAGAVLTAVGLG